MIPETPITPETISGKDGERDSSNSSISLDTGILETPVSGTAKPIRILLGQAASDYLTAAGDACFSVVGRQSHPQDSNRWILHLIPCDIATANDAVAVAQGRAAARKIKRTV